MFPYIVIVALVAVAYFWPMAIKNGIDTVIEKAKSLVGGPR
jgi:hypothetical protein